jgi:hypothetical protein
LPTPAPTGRIVRTARERPWFAGLAVARAGWVVVTPLARRVHGVLRARGWSLAVALVTLLAFALRAYRLDAEGFWLDEALTVGYAGAPLLDIPQNLASQSVHPPLYFMLVHPWVAHFGASEHAVRATSVICGVLGVPLIAALARKVFDARAGLIAALLLTVAPLHIGQSQNARPYALLGMLVLMSLLAYVIVTALVAYTHVFGLFTLVGQAAHYVVAKRARPEEVRLSPRVWLLTQLAVAVLFLPWLGALLGQIGSRETTWAWIPAPTLTSLWDTAVEYCSWNPVVGVALLSCAVVGAVARRARAAAPSRWLTGPGAVVFWVAAPLVTPFVVSYLYHPVYFPRYTIQAFLALTVLAAGGLSRLLSRPTWTRSRPLVLAGAVALIALVVRIDDVRWMYDHPQNEDWRGVARILDERVGPDEIVVYGPSFIAPPVELYARRSPPATAIAPGQMESGSARSFDIDELSGRTPETPPFARIWLVAWEPPGQSPSAADLERQATMFGPEFERTEQIPLFGARIVSFGRVGAEDPSGADVWSSATPPRLAGRDPI